MTLTTQDVQRYTRIGLQWLAAYLVSRGFIDKDAGWVQPIIGAIVGLASLGWTMYSSRIEVKINEIKEVFQNNPEGLTFNNKVQLTNTVAALSEVKSIQLEANQGAMNAATAPNVSINPK